MLVYLFIICSMYSIVNLSFHPVSLWAKPFSSLLSQDSAHTSSSCKRPSFLYPSLLCLGEGKGVVFRSARNVPSTVLRPFYAISFPLAPRASFWGWYYCAHLPDWEGVSSGWSSDLFKVIHRRIHRGAESESERRPLLQALLHPGLTQVLNLWGSSEGWVFVGGRSTDC